MAATLRAVRVPRPRALFTGKYRLVAGPRQGVGTCASCSCALFRSLDALWGHEVHRTCAGSRPTTPRSAPRRSTLIERLPDWCGSLTTWTTRAVASEARRPRVDLVAGRRGAARRVDHGAGGLGGRAGGARAPDRDVEAARAARTSARGSDLHWLLFTPLSLCAAAAAARSLRGPNRSRRASTAPTTPRTGLLPRSATGAWRHLRDTPPASPRCRARPRDRVQGTGGRAAAIDLRAAAVRQRPRSGGRTRSDYGRHARRCGARRRARARSAVRCATSRCATRASGVCGCRASTPTRASQTARADAEQQGWHPHGDADPRRVAADTIRCDLGVLEFSAAGWQ
ncbi:MAG: hypothetical protein MZV49_12740 [Rhodopseudomonas palustris]|nr:hypothetical protein [Rhodopseudomonas palustris]